MEKIDILNFFKKKMKNQISTLTIAETLECANFASREIYLTSITPAEAAKIDKLIKLWNEADDIENIEFTARMPIKIYMDSNGGSFEAMLTIMDIIKLSRTPIQTINIGVVQAEAFHIYVAGHTRYCYPKATFLYDQELKKDLDPVNNYYSLYEKQKEELKEILLERTKITETEYNKHSKNVWWTNSEEALRMRICNEIWSSLPYKK